MHGRPAHQGGLCTDAHYCPPCEDQTGPCVDLFMHPICGLVACSTEED